MELIAELFDLVPQFFESIHNIAHVFVMPFEEFLETYISGLADVGMFDGLTEAFPNLTLASMMFGSGILFTLCYSFASWVIDILP